MLRQRRLFVLAYCHSNMMTQHTSVRFSIKQHLITEDRLAAAADDGEEIDQIIFIQSHSPKMTSVGLLYTSTKNEQEGLTNTVSLEDGLRLTPQKVTESASSENLQISHL